MDLNEVAHSEQRQTITKKQNQRIPNRYYLLNKRQLRVRIQGLEDKLVTIPNTKRKRRRIVFIISSEIQELREFQSVVILRVKNRRTGLESLAGNSDGGHTAADGGMALEDTDLGVVRGGGVAAEEVGDGGAGDSAADYAD